MHDVIIVGAGPAGLTAALYAARSGLSVKLIEKMAAGGQMLLTESIDNFPGFPGGIEARKLVENLIEQVKELNINVDSDEIIKIKKDSNFVLTTNSAKEIIAKTIIIASGAQHKNLDILGEEKLRGKGISYCAICDGPLFRNKDVVVIGGGNKAAEEALTLERYANKVILMHRRSELRAVKSLQDKILSNKKIQVLWDTILLEFQGDMKLEAIKIKNVQSNKEDIFKVQGAFISVGIKPNTDFLKDLLKLDESGYIITDEEMRSSIEGVFAAGDCRKKSLRQVITACSEGAICAFSAFQYLENRT